MVILGTMVAICARSIDGEAPTDPVFYYHNNRNHFWKVLQYFFAPDLTPKTLTVPEKKSFLNQHGVAIANLVQEIEVPNREAADPSDTVLFAAQRKNRLQFKTASPKLKAILKNTPLFFTCRHKKGIQDLVTGYLEHNQLPQSLTHEICYLPTPTRCNPHARAAVWRDEAAAFKEKLDHG